MTYAFDTNIYQVWRNLNDPSVQRIMNHPSIQTVTRCFLDVEDGDPLVIPHIILTEHLVWIAKTEGFGVAMEVSDTVHDSVWNVIYEDEELHKLAIEIEKQIRRHGCSGFVAGCRGKAGRGNHRYNGLGFQKIKPGNRCYCIGIDSRSNLGSSRVTTQVC